MTNDHPITISKPDAATVVVRCDDCHAEIAADATTEDVQRAATDMLLHLYDFHGLRTSELNAMVARLRGNV